ncbi:Protein kinase-like domain [Pseudocohnilembus persalinus]|uniref:Protein kinase-like domain n=1 Tax=Pseudocohnilembus persalinus TaxID=266149 RepID=A0A0V0R2A2_PSEPJ|nr:Protein kinase-like domain [Pseudocohnilembus persalinus]|eukprot:KRX08636.1 Protein kinase-like domain [Pseudocohnilembus persalinus]
MNKLDEQENLKNDQEKITIKYYKNCEKYSDQNDIEQEKTYENINCKNPQRNYELNQIEQLQNGEKIKYNKQFVLNQQNLKLSSLLKDISGVFNQFEEDYQQYRNFSQIIEQFLQKENYLFHNYSTKYKKNKGQTQSVFTLYNGFKQEENSVAEGGFSEIYKVQMTIIQDNKQEVKKKFAVKKERYKSGRASHEKKILEMLEGKIQPNIAKFYWTKFPQCADDLIMEYYPNKSLDHFKVNFSITLSLTSKLYILWQIVQGIKFLKDNSISHLDLKPANILIGKQLNAKISDFGESYHPKVCGRDFNPGRTVPYVPPEILQKQQNLQLYHDRIDVFSFGVIMSEVLFDEYPLKPYKARKVLETVGVYKKIGELGEKKINNYTFLDTIGQGSFAKVKLAIKQKKYYAIKIMKKSYLEQQKFYYRNLKGEMQVNNSYQNVKREIAIMKKMQHPNLVNLYEVINNPENGKIYLVMDYIDIGQIIDHKQDNQFTPNQKLKKNLQYGYFSELFLRKVFRDCILGLSYCKQIYCEEWKKQMEQKSQQRNIENLSDYRQKDTSSELNDFQNNFIESLDDNGQNFKYNTIKTFKKSKYNKYKNHLIESESSESDFSQNSKNEDYPDDLKINNKIIKYQIQYKENNIMNTVQKYDTKQ